MKKILSMLLTCCLFMGCVTLTIGCGDDKDKAKKDTPAAKEKEKGTTPPKEKEAMK